MLFRSEEFFLFQINFFYDESEELGNITVAKCILNGKLNLLCAMNGRARKCVHSPIRKSIFFLCASVLRNPKSSKTGSGFWHFDEFWPNLDPGQDYKEWFKFQSIKFHNFFRSWVSRPPSWIRIHKPHWIHSQLGSRLIGLLLLTFGYVER